MGRAGKLRETGACALLSAGTRSFGRELSRCVNLEQLLHDIPPSRSSRPGESRSDGRPVFGEVCRGYCGADGAPPGVRASRHIRESSEEQGEFGDGIRSHIRGASCLRRAPTVKIASKTSGRTRRVRKGWVKRLAVSDRRKVGAEVGGWGGIPTGGLSTEGLSTVMASLPRGISTGWYLYRGVFLPRGMASRPKR